MPKSNNQFPPVTSEPGPSVVVSTRPTVESYNLDLLFPPVVNSALPNPKALDRTAPQSRQFVLRTAKPGDPLPYAFGRTLIKPAVIGADDSGEHLVLDLMWGVGEMQRVCNGIVPSIDPPGTWDYSIQFPDLGIKLISGSQFEHFTGTAGQSASSIMTALKGSYPAYPGIAHSVITMQPGWNLNIAAVCDAVMVIDPRVGLTSTVWTRNPALILADMLVRCGYTMDWTSVEDAADYCDEMVGDTGSEIERWKISGVVYERADLQSWIRTMQQYAHCFVDKVGSTFYLRPDKPRASNHIVTADDIRGTPRLKLRGTRNTVEGVRVNFNFHLRTLDAEFGVLTDPGTVTQLRMPFWSASFPYLGSHAKRHAEEVYNKSQLEIEELEIVTFDKGLERTVGDVGIITYPALHLFNREMTIIEATQVERGRWRFRYTDHSNVVYPETNYDNLTFNETDLHNPYNPIDGPVPNLNWTYNSETSPQPYLTLSWTGVTWAYTKDYDVRVYAVGSPEEVIYNSADDGYVTHTNGLITLDLSDRLVELGRTYQADVYVRSIVDVVGAVPGSATVEIVDPLLWDDTPITVYSVYPDHTLFGSTSPYATLEFFFNPADYEAGNLPRPNWITYEPCFAVYPAGPGEYLIRVDHVSTVSGTGISNLEFSGTGGPETGRDGEWLEFWDYYILDWPDTSLDSVAEHIVADVSLAPNDGTGSPIAGRVKTKRVTFVAYKGAGEFDVFDNFTGPNGTNINARAPDIDVPGSGWTSLFGAFTITSNEARANGGAAGYSINAAGANFEVAAEMRPHTNKRAGIIGRVQDISNHWKLEIVDPSVTNPILELTKVEAGFGTVMGSYTLTGAGPMGLTLLELRFNGDTITGRVLNESNNNFPVTEPAEITVTDATFNTEVACGIISSGSDVRFNRFSVSDTEITVLP